MQFKSLEEHNTIDLWKQANEINVNKNINSRFLQCVLTSYKFLKVFVKYSAYKMFIIPNIFNIKNLY